MPQVGSSFGNPIRTMHNVGLFDFGGGAAATYYIGGPKGCRGKIKEIIAVVSEDFVTVTTDGTIELGTAADADAYAKMTIDDDDAAVAANAVLVGADGYGYDTDAIISADVSADTFVLVTLTNGTGASVAGQAYIQVLIDWY